MEKKDFECLGCGKRYYCKINPFSCSKCERIAVRSIKSRIE